MDFDFRFGSDGSSALYEDGGWLGVETHLTWAGQGTCRLVLSGVEESVSRVLELHVIPCMPHDRVTAQSIRVAVNDTPLGTSTLIRRSRLAYVIPPDVIRAREPIHIQFDFPSPINASDSPTTDAGPSPTFGFARLRLVERPLSLQGDVSRLLPIVEYVSDLGDGAGERSQAPSSVVANRIRSLTGIDPLELMRHFESIGQSCEFGLLQRRCGAEPLGLFRFASIFLDHLLRGIETDFDRLGEPSCMDIRFDPDTPNPEFLVVDENFELIYHTFVHVDQAAAEDVRAQQARRLQLLKRKFLDDVREGRKIFVRICKPEVSAPDEAIPLYLALNREHDNMLLWVVLADSTHPAGTVDRIADRLFIGYIDRFAPELDAKDLSLDVWLSICTNAYLLSRGANTSVAETLSP